MSHTPADAPRNSTSVLILKIVLIFLFTGGVGGLSGARLIMSLNGGSRIQGEEAGAVLLVVSALLAVPGVFLVRRAASTAGRFAVPGQQEEVASTKENPYIKIKNI